MTSPKPPLCSIRKVEDVINPIYKRWDEDALCNLLSVEETKVVFSIPISLLITRLGAVLFWTCATILDLFCFAVLICLGATLQELRRAKEQLDGKLILELGPYIEELTKTGGAIKEFVNPNSISSNAGKFPTPVTHQEPVKSKVNETKATVKFQVKKVLCMGVAVGKMRN
ncbi:60S ribosomal protein L10a [Camellia lanceoleosa]|uniref:60S ribosomal protein L10a n=1 Tax=Camellia lanceoleosa TaxID=1840588 RepID=A0ACC0HI79_9ERIC|nr:60S ribosomal protein L10a [Camellia lanceoleosa]